MADEAARRESLRAVLQGEPVLAAWLFGSAASGRMGPLSDVDVAVLPEPGISDLQRLEIIGTVASAAMKAWGVPHADVVFLDEAPPVLGFAIASGERVYVRDEDACVRAEATAMSRYHDRLPYIERHRAALRERYKAGVFG